jgi:hypothetical protein
MPTVMICDMVLAISEGTIDDATIYTSFFFGGLNNYRINLEHALMHASHLVY